MTDRATTTKNMQELYRLGDDLLDGQQFIRLQQARNAWKTCRSPVGSYFRAGHDLAG
jgi:hypothetical protein